MPDADLEIKKDIHRLLEGLKYDCKAKYDENKRFLLDASGRNRLVESDGIYYHQGSQSVIYVEATTQSDGLTNKLREKHGKLVSYYNELERQVGISGNVINRILLFISNTPPQGDLSTIDQTTIRLVLLDALELEKYYLYLFKLIGEYLKYEFNSFLKINVPERPKYVQAINVNMSGHTVYVFELTIEEILKTCYVFRKKDIMDEGYQRLLNERKLKDLTTFLKTGRANLFPNSILINLHNEIQEPTPTNYGTVELKYPMDSGSFNIIDGQHRVYGYCGSGLDLSAQRLIVVAFKNIPDSSDEVRFFLKINRTQTPINSTLLSLLMAKATFVPEEREFWEAQGSKLALKLSENGSYKNNIFKGGIVNKHSRGTPTLKTMAEIIEETQLLSYRKRRRGQEGYELYDGLLQKKEDIEGPNTIDTAAAVINGAVAALINGVAAHDRMYVKEFLLTNRGFYVVCKLIKGYKLLESEVTRHHRTLNLTLNDYFGELNFTPRLIDSLRPYYGKAGMTRIAAKIQRYVRAQAKTNSRLASFRWIEIK